MRMFGRTLRLEPATGSRKAPGSGQFGEERPRRFDSQRPNQSSSSSGGFREYSTLRATVPGFLAVRRPVGLNQVNALVGRRMFGLAASVVLKRRVVWDNWIQWFLFGCAEKKNTRVEVLEGRDGGGGQFLKSIIVECISFPILTVTTYAGSWKVVARMRIHKPQFNFHRITTPCD